MRYKFKSSTMEYSVAFSGAHIGLIELKRTIVTEQKMSAGSEATLELTHAQSGTVYDDNALVARNTAVLVRRVPVHTRTTIVSGRGDTEINLSQPERPPIAAEAVPQQGALTADAAVPASAPAPAPPPAPARPLSKGASYASTLLCPLTGVRYVEAVITTCCGAHAWPVHDAWRMLGATLRRSSRPAAALPRSSPPTLPEQAPPTRKMQ